MSGKAREVKVVLLGVILGYVFVSTIKTHTTTIF